MIAANYWLPWSTGNTLPENAVKAGKDSDGNEMYIGRIIHAYLPVVITPGKPGRPLIWPNNNKSTEVLLGDHYKWVTFCPANLEYFFENAVFTSNQFPLREKECIGRATIKNAFAIGTVKLPQGQFFAKYDRIVDLESFEILVRNQKNEKKKGKHLLVFYLEIV